MDSWWLNGSLIRPLKKTPCFAKNLPYPKVSAREVPLRANRHVPDSIPTLRLAIARALAVQPEVLLMDEPCSALDPISTGKIEELIFQLKEQYTIVIVTHNMQQAARVAEFTGFFLLGKMIEFDKTEKIFTNPSDKRTEDYVTGRFG